MKTPRFCPPALTLLLLVLAPVAVLHAQATKIFVASFGNDANDGSRGSPKRNFQAAHNAVAAGGQIVVLDTAGYGQLNITKSLAVTVPPGVNGFVTVTGTSNAITVAAGAGSVVSLRGLIIEGGGSRQSTGTGSGFGIYATSVGYLTVEDCTIRNFLDALPFLPANSDARLTVSNTTVRNCRYGIDGQGVGGGAGAYAVISGCKLENVGDAVYATAFIRMVVSDCLIAHCDTAIRFASTPGYTFVAADHCKLSNVLSAIAGQDANNNKFAATYGNNATGLATGTFNDSFSLK